MINHSLHPHELQTFFITHELSNNPLIPQLITWGKQYAELNPHKTLTGLLSAGYSRRIVCTRDVLAVSALTREDIIEIVDFDAIKQVLLIIGKKAPIKNTATHWMIHNARTDIGVIFSLTLQEKEINDNQLPEILINTSQPIYEQVKIILQTLQHHTKFIINEKNVFITARTFSELHEYLRRILQ
ncbi:MAG: hypothetical protein KKC68_08055 [Candidatus Thermoplasmatota archaeon]|nr:hypothetical protein [Candidatus Thermoplasmatota archaeon]MBU1941711.1 hypothetical protein [Candidatus Thermoplasmatota archaeon]